jgi:amino acid transporter
MSHRPDRLLVRGFGLRQLTAHIFNYTVGSGIFVLPGIVAGMMGPSALLAYLLCAVIIGLIVMVFAEAGSRVAISGGPYAYVEIGLGPLPGFIAGLLVCLTDVSALGAVTSVLAGYIARLFGLDGSAARSVLMGVLLVGLAYVNVRGVRWGARLIETCTVAKLLPLLLFVAVGVLFAHPGNLRWTAAPTAGTVASTAGVLIFAFSGIEAALLPGAEFANPSRTVPRAAMLALGLVTIVYLLVQGVALGVLGPELAQDTTAPLATAAASFMGSPGRSLLLAGAGVSMFGWITGSVLAGPRVAFALSRDGLLPRRLSAVHPRFHTPHISIASYALAALALALTGTFQQLAVLSNVAALALYFMSAVAVWQLRRRDVRSDGEPFLMPGGAAVPILACVVILWVVVETITPRELIALGIVALVGVTSYAFRFAATRVRLSPRAP